jgi:hypothetical protein
MSDYIKLKKTEEIKDLFWDKDRNLHITLKNGEKHIYYGATIVSESIPKSSKIASFSKVKLKTSPNIVGEPHKISFGELKWPWMKKMDELYELYEEIYLYIEALIRTKRITTHFEPEDLRLIINGICKRIRR